jgi:hypothetical protein
MELALAIEQLESEISILEVMIDAARLRDVRNLLVKRLARLDRELADLRTMAI